MFDRRKYQTQAIEAVFEKWEKFRRVLIVLPTGSGKTIIFCGVTERLVNRGKRVLILGQRSELLQQAADKLYKTSGLICALEKGDCSCLGEYNRVVVGSVQTLMRDARLSAFPQDYFDYIIVDEAHHVLAESYKRIFGYFCAAKVLGGTATVDRGDMRDLGEFFDCLGYEYSLPQAISDGYLCKIKALTIPIKIDVQAVKKQAGDYTTGDIATALDPYLDQIATEMVAHCMDRKTVLFLPLIATSKKMQAILKKKGFNSLEVNGESPDRAETLKAFDVAPPGTTLCNSMLLIEGWDCASVDCIAPLRFTSTRSLFAQMVGRGMRLYPGKEYLLLLDFLWTTSRLDICRPASLIAQNAETAYCATQKINASASPVDLERAIEMAAEHIVQTREEKLAKKLEEMKHRKKKLVDPLQYEMSILSLDLSNYVPSFGWESGEVTDTQKNKLEKFGIYPDEIDNTGKAELLIEHLVKRQAKNMSSPKQIRFLERLGFRHVGLWNFDIAKKMINRIAANGWRVPPSITPQSYNN